MNRIAKILVYFCFISLVFGSLPLFCEEVKSQADSLSQQGIIDTLFYEAYLADKVGEKEEANQIYEKILEYYSPILNNPVADKIDKLRAFKEVVRIKIKQEEFENALRISRNLLNEFPDENVILETEAEVYHLYATYHLSQRDFDHSLTEYENILNLKKLPAEWYAFAKDNLAYVYLCKGDADKALYWYNRIIEDHPDLKQWPASAHYSIGQYYLEHNDASKAKDQFQIIIAKYPASDWAKPATEALGSLK